MCRGPQQKKRTTYVHQLAVALSIHLPLVPSTTYELAHTSSLFGLQSVHASCQWTYRIVMQLWDVISYTSERTEWNDRIDSHLRARGPLAERRIKVQVPEPLCCLQFGSSSAMSTAAAASFASPGYNDYMELVGHLVRILCLWFAQALGRCSWLDYRH